MAITVNDARTSLLNRKKDISDVSNTVFIEWCDFINKFYWNNAYNIDPERYITSTNILVIANTQAYTLPADFDNINTTGTGIYNVDQDGNAVEHLRLPYTGVGSSVNGYYFNDTSVVFTPLPASGITYLFRYIPVLATLIALTDNLQIPDRFNEYVVNALDVLYTIWDETDEGFADARFVRSLDNLTTNISRAPQISSLPVINSY